MDWLSIIVAALIIGTGLMESRKKKQKKEAKQARKAREARAKMADGRRNAPEQPPRRPASGHPYAESPKEQGMTLDDFRRKYDNARQKAEQLKDIIDESLPEGVGSLKEGRGSTEGRGYTEGRGSREGRGYTEGRGSREGRGYTEGRGSREGRGYTEGRGSREGAPRRPKKIGKATADPVLAIPVEMAETHRQPPEKTVVATPIQTVYQEKTSGYDQIARQLRQQKLTPLQQAIIWSEILGPPKAKRPKGNPYKSQPF